MDLDVVGKVLILLMAIPFVLLLWGGALVLVDDTFCDGVFQNKIRQWVRDKMEDEE